MTESKRNRDDLLAEIHSLRAKVAESDRLRLALEAAEQAMMERTFRIQAFTRAYPSLIFIFDRDGRYLRVITEQRSLLVAKPQQLEGHLLHDFFPQKEADYLLEAIRFSLESGQPHRIEYEIKNAEGDFVFEAHIAPIRTISGKSEQAIFVAHEITSRKKAEVALAESEANFRLLYEDAPLAYQSLDEEGRIVEVNHAWEELTGYQKTEIIGKHITDLLTPQSREYFLTAFPTFKREKVVSDIEIELIQKNGSLIWVSTNGRITSKKENGLRTHCILRDITYEREVERNLRRSEEQFRQLAENIQEVYWLRDIENDVFIYVSPTYEKVWGRSLIELIEQPATFLESVHPEDVDLLKGSLRQGDQGEPSEIEFRLIKDDQTIQWIHLRSFPVRNQKGKIYRSASVATDITEIKNKEEAMKMAADIVNSIPSGLILYQYEKPNRLILIDSNPEVSRMTNLHLDQWKGKEFNEVWPGAKEIGFNDALINVMESGQVYQNEALHYQDDKISGSFRVRAFPIPGRRLAVAFDNITTQLEIELAEKRQRALAAALVATSEVINTTLDYDEVLERIMDVLADVVPHDGANIMMVDPQTDSITVVRTCNCYEQHDLIRPTERAYHIDEAPHLAQILRTGQPMVIKDTFAYPGWVANEEGKKIRSYAGAVITVDGMNVGLLNVDSATPNFFTEQHAEDLKAFANQASIAIHNARIYKKLTNYSENLAAAVAERTQELETVNEELKVLSQLKDEFVTNISHELNSPVTSLKIQLHLLGVNAEGIEKHLPIMQRETERLERTIQDLLQLSRMDQGRQKWEIGPMDINELIMQFSEDRKDMAEQNQHMLRVETLADLPIIRADGGLLSQVLSILLSNAFTFTPPGGEVTIRAVRKEDARGLWVGFSVSDNGPGILPEDQSRLFERFTRGKEATSAGQPGTGLGLALAKEIVDGHQGQIELVSSGRDGEGATFTIWLPAAPASPQP